MNSPCSEFTVPTELRVVGASETELRRITTIYGRTWTLTGIYFIPQSEETQVKFLGFFDWPNRRPLRDAIRAGPVLWRSYGFPKRPEDTLSTYGVRSKRPRAGGNSTEPRCGPPTKSH